MTATSMMKGASALLSPARAETYLRASSQWGHPPGSSQHYARAFDLYTWNSKLAAALWGPISLVEVVVRNAMHARFTDHFHRDDWWEHPSLQLCPDDRHSLEEAWDHASERCGGGIPPPGQVIATSSLGTWTRLLGPGTPRHPVLDYETKLWQPFLCDAFPHRASRGRKYIHSHLRDIQRLRNRIAHNEPLFKSPVQQLHEKLLEVAGMVHPEAEDCLLAHSRATSVLAEFTEVRSGTWTATF